MRSTLGLSFILSATLISVGCGEEDPPGTGGGSGGTTNPGSGGSSSGSGGSTSGSGGGSNGGGTLTGDPIFDGTGAWIDGAANTWGVQGSFFVLEDSVEDGAPLPDDGLTHTDLTPDSFGETTTKPCVSGSVAKVTAAGGADCDPAGSDCEWSALWGGGIGLNLSETGAGEDGSPSVKSEIDLVGAGIEGFSFELSGQTNGAIVRFKVKDSVNPSADFCTAVPASGVTTVRFSDLKHNCYQGGVPSLTLDPTKAVQVEWQIVTDASNSYDVENFCVEKLAVVPSGT